MISLDVFSAEEQARLISLPYQVGVHISDADGSGGHASEQQEMKALSHILGLLPGLYKAAPLTREILQATKDHPNKADWHAGTFDLTQECAEAMALLHTKAGKAEARAYRKALIEIAESVAGAADETGFVEIKQKPQGGLFKVMYNITKIFGFSDPIKGDNISPSEQAAIEKLYRQLT